MKNVLSTFAMLVVFGLIGYAGWYLYSQKPDAPEQALPLNAEIEIKGMLSPAKQEAVWEAEHMTFQIERRLGQTLLKAWADRDVDKLTSLFQGEFQAGIPSTPEWAVVSKPPVEERSRLTDQATQRDTDNLDEFLSLLLEPIDGVNLGRKKLEVLRIQKENDDRWSCRFLLTGSGVDDDANAYQYESESEVVLVVKDKKQFAAADSILAWEFRSETIRTCTAPIMEEVTSRLKLDTVDLVDNWELVEGIPRQHNFQIAVEDFDLDHDLDIAVMSVGMTRTLLAYEDGEYVDVTEKVGLPNVEKDPFGSEIFATAWIDIDNDGYPDLISGHKVFKNEQGKRFSEITKETYLSFDEEVMGYNVVDYNNDGQLDLYVIYQRPIGRQVQTDEGKASLASIKKWINESDSGKLNQLFKNNGNGTFSNVTELTSASGGRRHSHAAAWFFYNDDRFPDVYIANDYGRNIIFQNNQGQFFEDVSAESGADASTTSMGVVAGDINNDGRTDLYVSNMFSNTGRRIVQMVSAEDYTPAIYPQVVDACIGNQLYCRDVEGGLFKDLAMEAGVNQVGWAWAPTMMDLDSDGLLDLYCASGFMSFDRQKTDGEACLWRGIVTQPMDQLLQLPEIGDVDRESGELWVANALRLPENGENLSAFEQNRLFLNVDGKRFVDGSFASNADIDSDSRSVIAADFDRDGAVDLLVASAGGGPVRLFSNRLTQGNRIEIRLKGVTSNRMGIGSRIVAHCGDRKIVRDLIPQNGFMGIGPALAWIGTGKADKIDRLTIRWPTGESQEFLDVDVNRSIQIEEGSDQIETVTQWD